jgi:predicted flavoprotein YhiN
VRSFDTLTFSKKLQEAGFTARQAEAQAEALREVIDENLATKQDLKEMEVRLSQQIELVRRDTKELEITLRRDMEVMRRDIVIWLGGLIVVSIGALGLLMKIL